jgi:PncC family amidohydrolase
MAVRAPEGPGEDEPPLAEAFNVTDEPLTALAERLQAACLAGGYTLATAESCTGGLVAHAITEVPGSSRYFRGGFVTYADDVKGDLLGVPAELLAAHGAVSAQVARAMAEGARRRLGADLALAVTGIAGPDGGTAEKPVGLTYVAVVDGAGIEVRRHQWTGDRTSNKRESAAAVIGLALDRLGSGTTSGRVG